MSEEIQFPMRVTQGIWIEAVEKLKKTQKEERGNLGVNEVTAIAGLLLLQVDAVCKKEKEKRRENDDRRGGDHGRSRQDTRQAQRRPDSRPMKKEYHRRQHPEERIKEESRGDRGRQPETYKHGGDKKNNYRRTREPSPRDRKPVPKELPRVFLWNTTGSRLETLQPKDFAFQYYSNTARLPHPLPNCHRLLVVTQDLEDIAEEIKKVTNKFKMVRVVIVGGGDWSSAIAASGLPGVCSVRQKELGGKLLEVVREELTKEEEEIEQILAHNSVPKEQAKNKKNRSKENRRSVERQEKPRRNRTPVRQESDDDEYSSSSQSGAQSPRKKRPRKGDRWSDEELEHDEEGPRFSESTHKIMSGMLEKIQQQVLTIGRQIAQGVRNDEEADAQKGRKTIRRSRATPTEGSTQETPRRRSDLFEDDLDEEGEKGMEEKEQEEMDQEEEQQQQQEQQQTNVKEGVAKDPADTYTLF